MIDPHVHLRGFDTDYKKGTTKETVKHGISVAYRSGLDAIFDGPDTAVKDDEPDLVNEESILRRLELADNAITTLGLAGKFKYGVYAGITDDPKQIEEVARLTNKYNLWEDKVGIVGLTMFTCHSNGRMGIITEEQQKLAYRVLSECGYDGVLGLYCEKESLMDNDFFNHENPLSYSYARPPLAETVPIRDQIIFANEAEFGGILEFKRVSSPFSVRLIDTEKVQSDVKLVYEATPHHIMLNCDEDLIENLTKINPPLREKGLQCGLYTLLLQGYFNYIGTDHAPHTLAEKESKNPPSGVIGLPYYSKFMQHLEKKGLDVNRLGHDEILFTFDLVDCIPNTKRVLEITDEERKELAKEYEWDVYLM